MGSAILPQQRLLDRMAGHGLEIEWNLRRSRSFVPWRKRPSVDRAVVLDVSVGGARILAPADRSLDAGSVVTIGAEGSLGLVRLRWARETHEKRTTMFGLDYVSLEPALREFLLQPINDNRALAAEEKWASPTNR